MSQRKDNLMALSGVMFLKGSRRSQCEATFRMVDGRRMAWTSAVAVLVLAGGAATLSVSTSSSASAVNIPHQLAAAVRPPSAPRGWKVVSYAGVHVDVPVRWPVVDGMHTGFCGGPFPDTPTAFVGPNLNGAPTCPSVFPHPLPALYGVWLYPSSPPYGGQPTTNLIPGKRAFESDPSDWAESRLEDLLYHGVEIEVGIGRDTRLVQDIVHSIGFTRGVPNTLAAGACKMSTNADTMPSPERLSTPLVLDDGDEVLNPVPHPLQPTVSPDQVWRKDSAKWPYERYRVIFALLSAKYPATPGPNGLVPTYHDVPAWVIYSSPISPIEGCGMSALDVYSAANAQELESAGW
jgi:hypothetical protein